MRYYDSLVRLPTMVASVTEPCRLGGVQDSRCKDARYCCKEHSDSVSVHLICVAHAEGLTNHTGLETPQAALRPSRGPPRPIMVDAILFPADSDKPRINKLLCDVRQEDDPFDELHVTHRLDFRGEYFRLTGREPRAYVRPMLLGGGEVIELPGPGYIIDILYFLINGSQTNRCAEALTRGTSST